jgi:hypothetical protein
MDPKEDMVLLLMAQSMAGGPNFAPGVPDAGLSGRREL